MPPQIRYARSGDVHIAYPVTGDGPLDLVFVREREWVPRGWRLFAVARE